MDTKVADPLHGALLGGRYRIMGRLARGGMATVYQAVDERLERPVAVKIIHSDRVLDAEVVERLADEAKTVARLGHPNIVAVYDEGSHDGAPYVVMEYVRGRTLREVLTDRRRLDPAESLAILEQLLAALAVAHRTGLVHRDVKPENILIAPPPNGSGDLVDAVVKVADFGLAHAVEVGRPGGPLLATPEYVAPELVADGRADARADVYSAGIVLFEMLTGRVPFDGDRPADVAWQHVDHDVPPPSQIVPGIPSLLDDVVSRATRRDQAGRPRDAAAMLAEIQSAREDVGALAGPTRALAHPTVIVPSMSPLLSASGADGRPSWARLPAQRSGATSARDSVAAAGRRIAGLLPEAALQRAMAGLARGVGWLRNSAQGRRQLTTFVVVVGILFIAGGWWLGFGRYTQAPTLLQLTKANAVAEAARQGFKVDYSAGIYTEQIPADTVMQQRPEPGGRIVKGGTVTLTLSLGPERYAVPDVRGQDLAYALSQMPKQLLVQTVDGFSDTLPVGYVVGTDPEQGTLLKPNSAVKIIVARGGYPVHVPTVLGMKLADATAQLNVAGFTNIEVQHKDDAKPKDTVLEQNPPGGQGMASGNGQKVLLIVSNGPAGAPMPSVVGLGCKAGADQLRAMQLTVTTTGLPEGTPLATVKAQSVKAGDPVKPGDPVTLTCNL